MKTYKNFIKFIVLLILAGQILFAFAAPRYTKPSYENRIFATTGIERDTSDLQKLNEAAHYFGQTMIGWTKFPNFAPDMISQLNLPSGTSLNAHIQERQNIIFTVTTPEPISIELLKGVKDYMQSKIDEYNASTKTRFILTNLDYDQTEIKSSYAIGALITLVLTVFVAFGLVFIRKELF